MVHCGTFKAVQAGFYSHPRLSLYRNTLSVNHRVRRVPLGPGSRAFTIWGTKAFAVVVVGIVITRGAARSVLLFPEGLAKCVLI